ncbi:MAG: ATP-binding cassette domain-containing protein [Crocinitomicaceae bacterium]|nr:ATP-binding cassette domain-containing protein [Crocinitomicaceae bacterium]
MKSKEFIITRVWSLLKPDKIDIRNSYIFAIFSGLLSLGLPLGIQMIINFIQLGQLSASWFLLVGLVVSAIGFSGLMNILQLKITENLQQRIFTRSAFEFAFRLPKMKVEALRNFYNPELSSRFFDTLTIQKAISKLLIDFMAASLQIVFGLGLLAFYHSFFIFFGFTLLLILFILIRFTSKAGYSTSLKESSVKYKIASWLNVINGAHTSFRTANTDFQLNKTDGLLNEYLDERKKHFKILMKQYQFLILFKVLITLCLLIVGGFLVLNQQMNIGQFVAVEIIIVLVLSSVEKIILNLDLVYDVLTAIEKIGQVTDLPLEEDTSTNELPQKSGGLEITIKDLNYTINQFNQPILKNVSFSVLQNEKVSLIVDSSISSNALFMIVLGMYKEYEGAILIDHIPVENLNLNSVIDSIGTLLEQDKIIYGTFKDNLLFGNKDIPLSKVIEVTEQLGMTDFVESIVNKYEGKLNPESYLVPTEIQKKMIIARSLIRNPRILLLEEPTSELSALEQKRVTDSIFASENCSFIIATKDEKIHAISDKIIEIRNGEVVFIGNFDTYSKLS